MAGNRFRYGAWRDGPDPLAPPYDVRAAGDEVGERVLAGDSLRDVLRDLLRRGPREGRGLDEMRARARRLRRGALRGGGPPRGGGPGRAGCGGTPCGGATSTAR